jgi:hypothetical protein
MAITNASVQTTLRIPGAWSHPSEMLERMPAGFRVLEDSLLLPGGV